MPHHRLDPEATGTVGPGAVWTRDKGGVRRQADPLRCEFAGWLGDDLVGVQPDFIVSGALADALRASDLTGFELRDVIVTRSAEFVSHGGVLPGRWERLVTAGDAEAGDDLSDQDGVLLVSERALALLNEHRIVEASITAARDTDGTGRFVRQRDEARAAALVRDNAEQDARIDAGVQEAARITALLDSASASTSTPPTMRTNATREIAGDLTLAATALGGGIEDGPTLDLLRLIDGPIEVDQFDANHWTYRSADGSVQVHLNRDVVTCVEFVLRPHGNAPEAEYSRTARLIDGIDPFTREAVLDNLGDPKATKTARRFLYDEYRLSRKRVLLYWSPDDHSPQIIIAGRKA